MARRALVTGGTGFAGRHLIAQLLEQDPAVHAWSNPAGRLPPADDGRVRWEAVDLLDREAVAARIASLRPCAIYHCAGIADVAASWTRPARALEINALGTWHLLDAVRRAGLDTRVLVTGSALVYRASREPLTEDAEIGPASPYGVSKLAQEMMALRTEFTATLIARPFNHAGPGQSDAYVTSSFARQIAEAELGLRERELRVGNLESRRDITDVRDTVRAYQRLMEAGRPARPYNVCRGQAFRIGDLLEMLTGMSRVALRVEPDPARMRPSDSPIVLGDPSRIRAETGWTPAIPIERTLADLLEFWRGRLSPQAPA